MRHVLAGCFFVLTSFAAAQVYAPDDANSKVVFKIKNFGSAVKGTFTGLRGKIIFDSASVLNTSFDVTINAATVDTGIGLRDNHLRKPDYFGVTQYPTIRFVSDKVKKSGKANQAVVTGRLTIKNTTREVSFPFSYSQIGGVVQFSGEFKIDRRDFEVGGNSISLSDEVTVSLSVSARQ